MNNNNTFLVQHLTVNTVTLIQHKRDLMSHRWNCKALLYSTHTFVHIHIDSHNSVKDSKFRFTKRIPKNHDLKPWSSIPFQGHSRDFKYKEAGSMLPIKGVWGLCPQWGPGHSPWSEGQGLPLKLKAFSALEDWRRGQIFPFLHFQIIKYYQSHYITMSEIVDRFKAFKQQNIELSDHIFWHVYFPSGSKNKEATACSCFNVATALLFNASYWHDG